MTRLIVTNPVIDLLRTQHGPRDRQLLFGDAVTVSETRDEWCRVTSAKDGYQGWVHKGQLGPHAATTHWVSVLATHAYARPDIKSPDHATLSLGSRLRVVSEQGGFLETDLGFVPSVHTAPVGQTLSDPVSVAQLFLGTPYLWGGNSRLGLDCSGLVQAALLACGIACPGDSGEQERALGHPVPDGSPVQRGDLLFWKGHVALVAGDDLLLHANAFHMAVAFEPMDQAIARIQAQGDGPVTAQKRL